MLTRTLMVLAAAAAVFFGASNATAGLVLPQSFEVEADGLFTPTLIPEQFEIIATVTSQDPDLGFTDLSALLTLDFAGGLTGQFELSGTDGSLFADIVGSYFDAGGFTSSAGMFEVTGGTGIFDGVLGEGVFSTIMDNATGNIHIHIAGLLVPAPATLALLGIGGLIGSRRRRA